MSDTSAANLPPKPDPATGSPRPPRAPVYGTPDNRAHNPAAPRPRHPQGCGPTLEAYVLSPWSAWSGGLFVVVLFVGAFTLFGGLSWVSLWWMWVLIVAVAAAIVFGLRGTFCAAGSDWLKTQHGWVKTYELTEVEMHLNGTSIDLFLRDASGRGTNNQIAKLQNNQDLWDLVYNGIRHSVTNGAKTNGYARGALNLGKKSDPK